MSEMKQRVLWSKKSESEYEYLLLTTLGSEIVRIVLFVP